MEEEIAELEKTGATELAGKLREKWKTHSSTHDTLKAEHSGAAKKLAAAEKELAKYKADLEAASKGGDERLTALTKERDDFKTQAEQRAADLESFKLRVALGDKLGVQDAKIRKRALDVFLAEYRPDGAGFDDQGELQGFDKALESFKKAEPFFFVPAPDPGNGGGRLGADPKASVPRGKEPPKDKIATWAAALYPETAQK